MPNRLRIRRGNETQLPTLLEGEPGYSVDTHKLHIGNATGGNTTFINNEQIDLKLKDKETQLAQKIDSIQDTLDTHYTANQEQSNFNFIENKVVQDGLIDSRIDDSNKSFFLSLSKIPKAIQFKIIGLLPVHIFSNNEQLRIAYNGSDLVISAKNTSGTLVELYKTKFQNQYKEYFICIIDDDESINILINSLRFSIQKTSIMGLNISQPFSFGHYFKDIIDLSCTIKHLIMYDKTITTQQIQHNFSVLNNSPSIKELYTTDSTGKTSILKLASDEDHVEMASGRTLREEYMSVLKTMGKEFTSADGSPIQVPNGVEARVINAEVRGQTVKNYCVEYGNVTDKVWAANGQVKYINDGIYSNTNIYQGVKQSFLSTPVEVGK